MKTYRSLIPLALLSLLFFAIGCGTSDGGDGSSGTGDATDSGRGSTSRDSGTGRDAGTADTGGGGGACGAATPCTGNADCTSEEFCNAGCCAPRGGGGGTDMGGGGEPCGDITFQGECDGTVARWCDEGTLGEVDCATMFPAEAATGVCTEINEEFGVWCAVQPGDTCLFSSGDELINAFCTGTDPGCIMTAEAQACRENVGPCTEDDDGTCSDDGIFVAFCMEGQPVGFDCVGESGGSCTATGCVDQAEGALCGAMGEGLEFTCADGMTCDTESGECVAE